VDALTYGLQLPDYSVGMVNGQWVLTTPTPGASNQAAPVASQSGLVINEWLANAAAGGSDWLELYNPATQPVSLQGLFLAQGSDLCRMNALSFLSPLGHLQLFADEKPGAAHLDFKLPAAGGTIVLSDRSAIEVNRVTYSAQAQGVSQGRLPDNSATITNFVFSPSPGASNYVVAYNGPYLNEILARNHSVITNAAGHTSDWVELYNPLDTAFDLSGFRLDTAKAGVGQWIFPAGVIIPSHGHRIIYCDGTLGPSITNETELNASIFLHSDHETVYLFDPANHIVDTVEYGPQPQDLSIGRAGATWTLLATPTPGASNTAPATLGSASGVRINEWLANPSTNEDQFVELYNSGNLPVQLSGLYLTDDLSIPGLSKFQIPPLSFIGPLGFAEFRADGDPSQGFSHLNFRLAANSESLRLASASLAILDTVAFGLQSNGVSQGRLPDGAAGTSAFAFPTPGLPNIYATQILLPNQPRGDVVFAGTNVAFSVTALGLEPLAYQWYFNDTPISNANTAVLLLPSVQAANEGRYRVQVTNVAASTASVEVVLALHHAPGILAQPLSRTNTVGETVRFSVTATSTLPASVQWRFNGTALAGETNAILSLTNVSTASAGVYRAGVSNLIGETLSDPATLTLVAAPKVALAANGSGLQLSLTGQPQRDYAVDTSTNLVSWTNVVIITLTNPPQTIYTPAITNAPKLFLRVRLVP
jgi:hypothetical protein